MKEINQSKIKEINRKKILNLLQEKEQMSKMDISRCLDISITTVSTNINELKEEGLVEEVGQLQSTGGRKAMAIKLLEKSKYSIGLALTPDKVKIVLINFKKQVVDEIRINHENDGIENIIAIAKKNIMSILKKNCINSKNILGMGISIPGTVDTKSGEIKYCYLLKTKDFNIKESFSELNIPIFVDNEANLSAYYEFLNNEDKINNLLYVSITDGLGVGIIIDGKIYRGHNNAAGEMGHTKIAIDGKQCKCGKKGCLEAYVSKHALIDIYNEAASIKINNIDCFERLIDEKDDLAIKALEKYIDILGVGISNLIMILDPHSIVFGGDINTLLKMKFNDLKEVLYKENIFTERHEYQIKIAKYKESYLLGSAMVPMKEYLKI